MSRYAMCPDCGHRMRKIDDETYYCPYCERGSDFDDIPEGCRACGGDYPNGVDSCALMDD